ncbi:MAG: hypothetical protein IJJ26_03095, partial [Victivallales bacterium]|nr:hypothetical protein [Victivallales bacterium]
MKLPRNEFLHCDHLTGSSQDVSDLSSFQVAHKKTSLGRERYLKHQAILDERDGVMRSYLVRLNLTNECVGYFSLKAGLISLNEDNQ